MRTYSKRIVFIAILLLVYLSFVSLDLHGGSIFYSTSLKFTYIIICFCYACLSKGNNKSISYTIKAAMLFTLISDLFILILDYYLFGVLTFMLVQLLYNYRISLYNSRTAAQYYKKSGLFKSSKAVLIFARWIIAQVTAAACICVVLNLLGVEMEALLIAGAVYFTGLVINTVRAVITVIKGSRDQGMIMFAAGLVFFLLCDINVGLFNLTGFIDIPQNIYSFIYNISSVLMWIFYAPSQALIVLSIEKSK